MPSEFYVYELSDPRDGAVFYVGKGKGSRLWRHEVDAKAGKPGAKCDRIRDILADGLRPQTMVVQSFRDETSAYRAEAQRIAHYGLDRLTNISPGGAGGCTAPYDPVREARDVIRSQAKTIRRVMIFRKFGIGVRWKGLDFIETGYEIAVRMRELAGAEYFNQHIGAV
jgi:hypothetical protein